MKRREEILKKLDSIQPLSDFMEQLTDCCICNPKEMDAIISLIESDAVFQNQLLDLLNNSYFAKGESFPTLREASHSLAESRFRELVVVAALAPVIQGPIHEYDISSADMIRHSLAVAIGAETLADALQLQPPDSLFLTGFLHDLGKIILDRYQMADAREILQEALDSQISIVDAELKLHKTDHGEVGAILLTKWNFPEEIVKAVRWHHRPLHSDEPTLMLDLINVADSFALMMGIGTGSEGLYYPVTREVEERLKLKPRIAEKVMSEIPVGLEQLESWFIKE